VSGSHIVGDYESYDLISCTMIFVVGYVAMVMIFIIFYAYGSLLLVQLVYHKLCVPVL